MHANNWMCLCKLAQLSCRLTVAVKAGRAMGYFPASGGASAAYWQQSSQPLLPLQGRNQQFLRHSWSQQWKGMDATQGGRDAVLVVLGNNIFQATAPSHLVSCAFSLNFKTCRPC